MLDTPGRLRPNVLTKRGWTQSKQMNRKCYNKVPEDLFVGLFVCCKLLDTISDFYSKISTLQMLTRVNNFSSLSITFPSSIMGQMKTFVGHVEYLVLQLT